jgi:hypothetical protein
MNIALLNIGMTDLETVQEKRRFYTLFYTRLAIPR